MQHEQPAEQPQALDPPMQTAQADQVQRRHQEQQLENEAQREAEQGAHHDEPEVAQAQERPQQSEQQRSEERQLPEPAEPLQRGDERMERAVAASSAGGPAESPRPSPRSSAGPTLDEIYKSIMVQKVCSFSVSSTPSVIACVLLYSVIHCHTAHPAAEILALGMPLQRCCLVCLLCLVAVAMCTTNLS